MALELKPAIADKIEELRWMGGSFLKEGNVAEPDCDGTQEWNAFWDPEAVKTVFDSKLPLTMVALESTNNVPLTNDIRLSWAKNRRYIGLDFIGNSYAFVPELRDFPTNSTYYLWDVLTTCSLYKPDLVKEKEIKCDVMTQAPSDGRTYLTETGREAKLVYDVDHDSFFETIMELAKRAQ